MGATTKTLHDTDFVEWTEHTADLLRTGRLQEVDLENLAEEIEDLGKSDRAAVRSQLSRMLLHLIKQTLQPERSGSSWRASILSARREILIRLEDSPSLRRHLEDNLQRIYQGALADAMEETGVRELDLPEDCPYSLTQLLDGDPFEPIGNGSAA
jgi:hypothetical protein